MTINYDNSYTGIAHQDLLATSLIVAIQTVGIVQHLKNYFDIEIAQQGKVFSLMALVTTLLCAYMNSGWVRMPITITFNLFAVSLALVQLCWSVIVKTLPRFVESLFDKLISKDK